MSALFATKEGTIPDAVAMTGEVVTDTRRPREPSPRKVMLASLLAPIPAIGISNYNRLFLDSRCLRRNVEFECRPTERGLGADCLGWGRQGSR